MMQRYLNFRNYCDWSIAVFIASILIFDPLALDFSYRLYRSDGRLLLTVATISATLLGFSLAAGSFLVTHSSSEKLKLLKESKGFSQLVDILRTSFWRLFMLSSGSLVAFGVYDSDPDLALIIFSVTLVVAFIAIIVLIWALGEILRLL